MGRYACAIQSLPCALSAALRSVLRIRWNLAVLCAHLPTGFSVLFATTAVSGRGVLCFLPDNQHVLLLLNSFSTTLVSPLRYPIQFPLAALLPFCLTPSHTLSHHSSLSLCAGCNFPDRRRVLILHHAEREPTTDPAEVNQGAEPQLVASVCTEWNRSGRCAAAAYCPDLHDIRCVHPLSALQCRSSAYSTNLELRAQIG